MSYERAPGRPMCRYDLNCYRKNPAHWKEFDHSDGHAFLLAATQANQQKRSRDDAVASPSTAAAPATAPAVVAAPATAAAALAPATVAAPAACAAPPATSSEEGAKRVKRAVPTLGSAAGASSDAPTSRSAEGAKGGSLHLPTAAEAAERRRRSRERGFAPVSTPALSPEAAAALAARTSPEAAAPSAVGAEAEGEEADGEEEVRVDEADGEAYPLASFLEEYGELEGRAKWERAPGGPARGSSDASASRAALPPRGEDPPGGEDPLGPLRDGEQREVQGSAAQPYVLKRTGGLYSCSCPAWRNQGGGPEGRTCKHLKGLRGEAAELERVGSRKAFYNTGARVAGKEAAPTSAAAGAEAARKATVALASQWDEKKDVAGWVMMEKLDGERCLWDGEDGMWTRSGKRVVAPRSFLAGLPRGITLDGELWMGRGNFQTTMTVVRRQDAPKEWERVTFTVYDAPGAPGGIADRLAAARAALPATPDASLGLDAQTAAAAGGAAVLAHEVCRGAEHVKQRLAEVEAAGGEGLILRHPTAAHRGGRTTDVLKVKSKKDDEALVIGHEPGKGKHEGRLGALLCKLRSGVTFKVGTGFSDAEREDPPPVGSVVTFQYFELTEARVPRFPAYQRVRPDVAASDFR